MTDDRKRLEQYLEWRRNFDRERQAVRRRRWLASTLVVIAMGTVGAAVSVWMADRAWAPAELATVRPLERRPPAVAPDTERPSTSAPLPSPTEPLAPQPSPAPPPPRATRDTRPRFAPAARQPSRPRALNAPAPASGPPPISEGSESPDVAAGVTPPVTAPVTAPAEPDTKAEVPAASTAEAPVPPLSAPEAPAATPAAATPETPAPVPAPSENVAGPPTPPVPQPKATDRVAGWLKGEVQEFRDGVKREIGDFRSGYEKVRDTVLKLRGPRPAER